MFLIFGKIKSPDPAAYITAKLELWNKKFLTESTNFDLSTSVRLLTSLADKDRKDLATVSPEIPPLSPEQAKEVEARKKCALQQIAERSPLLSHETLECDEFTFLQTPLGDIPAFTPFLRRSTNLAVLVYIFPEYRINVAQACLVHVDQAPVDKNAVEATALTPSVTSESDAVTQLATALVQALLKWAGLSILSSVFPDKVPSYFQAVYAELRKIVRQEITSNTIAQITGSINGIASWSKYEYKQMKQEGVKPDVLIGLLREQSINFYTQIQTLMVDRFAMPGIQVFLVAGSLHLFLYQEIALESSVQTSLQNASESSVNPSGLVELYAKHAETTFEDICKIRSKQVSVIYDPLCVDYPPHTVDRWYWEDTFTGKRSPYYYNFTDKNKKYHPGEPRAEADCRVYIQKVEAALNTSLGDPLGTAKKWREANKKPT